MSRQVLTSRNIRSSLLHDFLYGGLNYRIEHHLFPTVPRPYLRKCQPLTMADCAEQGLEYYEVSAARSYAEVLAHLRQVTEQVCRSGGQPL
ncbi:fatty acid desaturase family protein [Streptomyces lavendulae]|uniref:fatty acid desaturase family protein n=1 Tax=Streptomyces lavendulae TaxID=1914 RepID=UPI00368D003C